MVFMKMPQPLTLVTVPDKHTPTRLLRPSTVAERIGLSIPTIWRLRRRGDFPAPVRVSAGAIAFIESDIEKWIADRSARFTETVETA